MNSALRSLHESLGAILDEAGGQPTVASYGDEAGELAALGDVAGVFDLSARGRLCLLGRDRLTFLHGQVTNQVERLRPGQGCYAFLVNAKARIQSDLRLYVLPEEILLDCEPGWGPAVRQRLEEFIIADDVQVVDAAAAYAQLSVQGPRAGAVAVAAGAVEPLPNAPGDICAQTHPAWGEVYWTCQPRLGTAGYDLFVPQAAVTSAATALGAAAQATGGRWCGQRAFETARIEAGIPRFGVDMDETNLAPEAGLDARAIAYDKGCYTGQEIIARIRTYGQVTKVLRRLALPHSLAELPTRGARLSSGGKEAGYLTSATRSARTGRLSALGYVHREFLDATGELELQTPSGPIPVRLGPAL